MNAEEITLFFLRKSSNCKSVPRNGTFFKEFCEKSQWISQGILFQSIQERGQLGESVSLLIPWKQLKTDPAVKAFTVHKCCFLQKILNDVQITFFFPLAAKGRQAELVSKLVSFHDSSQLLLLSFLKVFVSLLSLLECI